LTQKETRL